MSQPRPTVLIVDDERGPRESLRIILKPSYEVLTADSGAAALELLRTHPVDLISLDLNMPGIKGDELMRTVRREFPDTEVVVITGYGSVESAAEAVRYGIADYLQKPFDVVQVSAAVTRALARQRGRRRMVGFLDDLGQAVGRDRDVRRILEDIGASPELQERVDALIASAAGGVRPSGPTVDPVRTVELLELLAETIEAKDCFMRGHARRTAYYAGLLADRLCLGTTDQERIRLAAFLHDLGKVGLPGEVLLKPGPLEPRERETVRTHPGLGARLVEPLGLASDVATAIRHHHEWWDGSGYPDGLCGDDIPLTARIIHLADAFDAMTCDRPYRRRLPLQQAVEELRRFAGVQFDPELTKEFLVILESRSRDVDLDFLAEAMTAGPTPGHTDLDPVLAEPSMRMGER